MRRKNWRVVFAGGLLVVLALGFFLFMMTMASKSNDPAQMMRIVGQVSGAGGGLGVVMILFGLIGTRQKA